MVTLLANQCRCSRGLRAHDLEGRPLCRPKNSGTDGARPSMITELLGAFFEGSRFARSEEHTSELQSPYDLVCRLLLEKKKKKIYIYTTNKHKNISLSTIELCLITN